MTESSSSQRIGTYICQQCGNVFQAEKELSTKCPHCGAPQIDTAQWQKVIVRRTHQISFETETEIEDTEHRKDQDLHLDLFGRRKAIRRLFFIIMGLLWIAGIGFIIFKKVTDESKKPTNNVAAQNTSFTTEDLKFARNFQNKTWLIINQFLNSPPEFNRAPLLIGADSNELERYFSSGANRLPIQPQKMLSVLNQESYVEASVVFENKNTAGFIFVKKGNNYLIDWDHFTNQGTMPFTEFIEEEPDEEHTFRLFFTVDSSGATVELNFIDAQVHNEAFNTSDAANLRIKIFPEDPNKADVDELVESSKKLIRYHSTLPEKQKSILREDDPHGYYRANVNIQWQEVDGRKTPVLTKVNAAHWLGDHYPHMFTPTQEITNAKR